MSESDAMVFVVDDDELTRDALHDLICSIGLRVQTFRCVPDFLAHARRDLPCCLVLDIRLPGPSGLDLQAQLAAEQVRIPIIFMSGHSDIPIVVRAMRAGALDFLTKPFREQELLDAIREGIVLAQADEHRRTERERIRRRYDALTCREREVALKVIEGLPNKLVAFELNVSEITVKVHRHHVMEKMHARSLPDLVRMIEKLHTQPPPGFPRYTFV
jgi:FixJ family two-component response regulator